METIIKLWGLSVLIGIFVKLTNRHLFDFVRFFFWIGIGLIIFGGPIGQGVRQLTSDIHSVATVYTEGKNVVNGTKDFVQGIPRALDKADSLAGVTTKYPPALTLREKLPFASKKYFTYPVSGNLTKGFAPPGHHGIDIGCNQETPVKVARPGYVAEIVSGHEKYGNYILVDHGGGWQTLYAHLSKFGVTKGQNLFEGNVIALSGGQPGTPGAGTSTGPHVHFEIRVGGKVIDPKEWM